MKFLNLLLSGATNPRVLISLVLALLIVALWVLGPSLLGLRGIWRILAIVLVGMILGVVQFFMAKRARDKKDRAAVDLETSLIMEADESIARAAGGEKAMREDARREMVAAINVIKNSRLADGSSSKAALYVLPWYLVLGGGGSGKSGVIRNSGLQRPGQGPGDLRGIGASSNCEWWFTNHAVILEADRRFTDGADAKSAESGWRTFLQTLGKQRPRTSLNGIIVTIPADELLGGAAGDVEARARLLRDRLDAAMDSLKQVFPVYLVVTKLDLVKGFGEYFAGLPDNAARQILGATIRAGHMRSGEPEKIFEHEFAGLYDVLCRRRQMRLVQEENSNLRDGIFLFPLEFRALGDNLGRFVRILFDDDVYGQSPLMRGFYFASVGGEGALTDAVLARADRDLGLAQEPALASTGLAGQRAHFLHDIFRRVIVPDRGIARPTRRVARRIRLVRRVLQAATLGALVVFLGLLTTSFIRNVSLIRSTRELAAEARNVAQRTETITEIEESLDDLDRLRRRLERLDELDRRQPVTLGLGLYRGARVNERAREIYLDRFIDVISEPSRQKLEKWLKKTQPGPEEYDDYYARYRTYRMLIEPSHGDAELMSEVLRDIWTRDILGRAPTDRSLQLIDAHVRYAISHADYFERLTDTRDGVETNLQRTANNYIRDRWKTQIFYADAVERINARRQQDLVFGLHMYSDAGGLLTNTDESRAAGEHIVPPAFTRTGWEEEFSVFLANSESQLREDWILREVFAESPPNLRAELLSLYLADYQHSWNRFLESVTIPPTTSVEAAANQIFELKKPRSPYFRLLEDVATNLTFERNQDLDDALVGDRLRKLQEDFWVLHAFWRKEESGEEPQLPLNRFMTGLQAIHGELGLLQQGDDHRASAYGFARDVFDGGADDATAIGAQLGYVYRYSRPAGGLGGRSSNLAMETILRQPALAAWRACLQETQEYLDRNWKDQVHRVYAETLDFKYPLSRGQADAGLDDFGAFFGVDGVLHSFVGNYLAPFLDARGEKPRTRFDHGLDLREDAETLLAKGNDLRRALFAEGGTSPSFRFRLLPRQARSEGRTRTSVSLTTFQLGNQRLRYDMGSARSMAFQWPPQEGQLAAQVMAQTDDGPLALRPANGPWSLLRLLDMATGNERVSNTKYDLTWTVSRGDGVQVVIPYELTVENANHPFRDHWFHVTCPDRLHR